MSSFKTALRLLIPLIFVVSACEDPAAPEPTLIEAFAGANQSGEVGATLPQPVIVRLLDAKGFPVRGVRVTWTVAQNSGALIRFDSVTDRSGNASATWLLGNATGQHSVTAQVTGLAPVTFTANAQAGAAALITLARDSVAARNVGDTIRIAPTVTDRYGNPLADQSVAFTSGNTNIATVNNAGLVTIRGRGATTITLQRGTVTAQFRVRVVEIARVVITPNGIAFASLNQTQQLTARAEDAAGVPFTGTNTTWTVANSNVAAVSSTGLVRAVGNGATQVTANVDGANASVIVQVAQVPTNITISPANPAVGIGSTLQLTATSRDALGSPVPNQTFGWTVSNPSVATVSGSGVVLGVGRGVTNVTATAGTASVTTELAVTPSLIVIAGGDSHTCALGAISATNPSAGLCWGFNAAGQLGNGTFDPSPVISDLTGTLQFTRLAAGGLHNCGILGGGQMYCWGSNLQGQLGSGAVGITAQPRLVGGSNFWAQVAGGYNHTCALNQGGNVFCWGSNLNGQLGTTSTQTCTGVPCELTPAPVATPVTATAIAAGFRHSCAIGSNGATYCWGSNSNGQLGTGNTTNSGTPVLVTGTLTFTQLSLGEDFSCGVAATGGVYCWGRGNFGQLGNGAIADALVPTAVSSSSAFVQVAAGFNHACGLTAAGEVWCWGANTYGQLGNNTGFATTVPLVIQSNGVVFSSIASGAYHTCGLTSSGAAYCWGRNTGGQLGNNTFDNSPFPVRVR